MVKNKKNEVFVRNIKTKENYITMCVIRKILRLQTNKVLLKLDIVLINWDNIKYEELL